MKKIICTISILTLVTVNLFAQFPSSSLRIKEIRVDSRDHMLPGAFDAQACGKTKTISLNEGLYLIAITGGPGISYGREWTPKHKVMWMNTISRGHKRTVGSLDGIFDTNKTATYFLCNGGSLDFFLVDSGCQDNSGYISISIYRL